jgi:predicted dinucleotide-binding enzyme
MEETIRAAGDLTGKILVDISNPITEDFKGLLIGHTTSAAEEIQKLAPGAKVVKAFNTIFAELLPAEAREGRAPVQVFVAGDDEAAKKAVSDVVAKGGFEPVDSGPQRSIACRSASRLVARRRQNASRVRRFR